MQNSLVRIVGRGLRCVGNGSIYLEHWCKMDVLGYRLKQIGAIHFQPVAVSHQNLEKEWKDNHD